MPLFSAIAYSALASDPAVVKTVADYVAENGKSETLNLGGFSGEAKHYTFFYGEQHQEVSGVSQLEIRVSRLIADNIKILFVAEKVLVHKTGNYETLNIMDAAPSQNSAEDGEINWAEVEVQSMRTGEKKYYQIDLDYGHLRKKVQTDYDRIIKTLNVSIKTQ